MIFLIITFFFTIIPIVLFLCKNKIYDDNYFFFWFVYSLNFIFFYITSFIIVTLSVSDANKLQAKIQLMQPASIDEAKLKRAEIEFAGVSELIKQTFDKYQVQATTSDFKGLKVYTAPFSAGGI